MEVLDPFALQSMHLFSGHHGGHQISGFRILVEACEAAFQVWRNMRTAFACKLTNPGKVGDGQNAGNQIDLNAACGNAVAQAQEETVVEEELRERTGGPVFCLVRP